MKMAGGDIHTNTPKINEQQIQIIFLFCSASGAVLEALSRLSVVYQDSSLISSTATRKMSFDTAGMPGN